MKGRSCLPLVATVAALSVASPAAAQRLTVGIAPFDVASIDGATRSASASMAKLVRVEMIRNPALLPRLLVVPAQAQSPLAPEDAASIGKAAGVDVVLVGTVLEASTSVSSHGANSGGLLNGLGIGARLDRVTARVAVHVELVNPATGTVADTFEVEGRASATGLGTDFSTVLGSWENDSNALERSPVGKALRDVAAKVTGETLRRAAKLKPPA